MLAEQNLPVCPCRSWLYRIDRLEELSQMCRARFGSIGAVIEDKNSGTILMQQALRRGLPAHPIDSKLIAMGKGRASAFRVRMRLSRTSEVYRSCLQQGQHI
jgi:hypothetical protein